MLKTILMTLALVLPPTVTAAATNSPAPAWLIEAIARQESSLNPLAVNVAGKTYYPATRQEAEAIIAAAQASGKSYDVGLMQINRWWIERHGIPPASLLDPDVNRQWASGYWNRKSLGTASTGGLWGSTIRRMQNAGGTTHGACSPRRTKPPNLPPRNPR